MEKFISCAVRLAYGVGYDDEGSSNGLAIGDDVGLTFWSLIPYYSQPNGPDGWFWIWSTEANILAICNSCWWLRSASFCLNCMKDLYRFFSNFSRDLWRLAWDLASRAILPDNWLESAIKKAFVFGNVLQRLSFFHFQLCIWCVKWSGLNSYCSLLTHHLCRLLHFSLSF